MTLTKGGLPVANAGPFPAYDDWFDHLNIDSFEKPVSIRIVRDTEGTMFPSYDIERLLQRVHGLNHTEDIDCAYGVEENRREIAFDAAEVDDLGAVFDNIGRLLDQYNQPPDDLPLPGKIEWLEATIAIAAIRTPTHD
jgi:hypothetical protein